MSELVMIGFADKHRALEVLPQLQRLRFDWTSDLQNAIVVEVEADGRLRMLHKDLLDPAADAGDATEWKALLSALVPLPHLPPMRLDGKEISTINAHGSIWLKNFSIDQDFARNAAVLLTPGNSAVLATIRDWQSAQQLLSGYSQLVLHTTIIRFKS